MTGMMELQNLEEFRQRKFEELYKSLKWIGSNKSGSTQIFLVKGTGKSNSGTYCAKVLALH